MRLDTLEWEPNNTENNQQTNKKTGVVGWIVFVLVLLGIFLVFRYVVGITVISGNSMSPTIENRNVLVANNLFFQPERNDIVIFRDEGGFDVIKRIIALPNETVEIKNGIVLVNGDPIDESYIIGTPNDMPETIVEADSFFVMGDNREPGESLDSRNSDVGSIPKDRIKGEILASVFPIGLPE